MVLGVDNVIFNMFVFWCCFVGVCSFFDVDGEFGFGFGGYDGLVWGGVLCFYVYML